MEFPKLNKEYLQNPTANIILNGKKLEAFLLRLGTRKDIPFADSFETAYWQF